MRRHGRVAIPLLSWLDLCSAGLLAVERLALEELLLRHNLEDWCWSLVGSYAPTNNGVLADVSRPRSRNPWGQGAGGVPSSWASAARPRLINVVAVKRDGILVVKRFSGGGTVVVDRS